MNYKGKIRVAIIEDNIELADLIKAYLIKSGKYEIVGIEHDGESGLRLIYEKDIDVVMLDMVLPVIDGITILERLKGFKGSKRPSFIMFTAVSAEALTQRALKLGADYFILKPFDLELMERRIQQVYYSRERQNETDALPLSDVKKHINYESPCQYVSSVLKATGMAPNLKGYTYLKTAIITAIENNEEIFSITKTVYPMLAERYSTTSSCVERAIRHAIKKGWEDEKGRKAAEQLGFSMYEGKRPSNSVFIRSVAEMYHNIN
ncbi:sporulation transcription factor Spo0A [Anaeropeptidivorans aminofermentans]|uniref:sporulation transcription factor Spo0A n=1 Tax=Anaeropeptidivorans aminofermentans TaxID=2934315 RepID=UPI002024A143|nr:sporulation transcription factor Spo0A [Anaeropeptidivorans aminofermentans]MBE6011084.1 sporulation transcription factor Spo0A [Lachnospiraceae bacterium]